MKYLKSEVLDLFVTRWFAYFIHIRGIQTQHFMSLSRTSSTRGVEGLQTAVHLSRSRAVSRTPYHRVPLSCNLRYSKLEIRQLIVAVSAAYIPPPTSVIYLFC